MDISPASWTRELRRRAGLTQAALARRAGTSQSAVARLEAGQVQPTVDTLRRLAAAAGFGLDLRLVPGRESDPVIEAYKRDLDRTLLRRNLGLTPDQRIRELAALQAFDAEVRRAGRVARARVGKRGGKGGGRG